MHIKINPAFLTNEDDALLQSNPDRGFRTGTSLDVKTLSEAGDYAAIKAAAGAHIDSKLPDIRDSTTVAQNYLYISGYNKDLIDDKGLQAIEAFYDAQSERGITGQPRFIYSHDMPDPVNDATQEIIMQHIDQLAPLIAKWKHAINVLQLCFIGAWGEWHSEYYELDKRTIGKAIMEKLVVPNGLYAQMRLPNYKNILSGLSYYDRIGIENDSFFGKHPSGFAGGTGGLDEGTEQWEQLVREAAYTPQDGELYWQYWFDENPQVVVDEKRAILQLSEHRFCTLSFLHSYLERRDDENTPIALWKKQSVDEEWLRSAGIIYDPSWFRDKNGQTVSRTAFEFIRDHLGYKLAITDVELDGIAQMDKSLQVRLSLVNYGFAAAFNLQSGFALLDANNQVVSTIESGSPETWYNRSPENYADSTHLMHILEATIRMPAISGHFKLAFYAKNKLGRFARLSNQMEVVNGYHILHEFDL